MEKLLSDEEVFGKQSNSVRLLSDDEVFGTASKRRPIDQIIKDESDPVRAANAASDAGYDYAEIDKAITEREERAKAMSEKRTVGNVATDLVAQPIIGAQKMAAGGIRFVGDVIAPEPDKPIDNFREQGGVANVRQIVGRGLSQFGGEIYQEGGDIEKQVNVEMPNATLQGLYGGAKSLALQAPMLGAPGVAAPLAFMGGQVGLDKYAEAREAKYTPGMSAAIGAGHGGIEVATELLPTKFFKESIGKAGLKEFVVGLLAREVPGEQAATLGQDAIDQAVGLSGKTKGDWEQYWQDRPAAAYQTLLATLSQSGLQTAGHAAYKKLSTIGEPKTNQDLIAQELSENVASTNFSAEGIAQSAVNQLSPDRAQMHAAPAASAVDPTAMATTGDSVNPAANASTPIPENPQSSSDPLQRLAEIEIESSRRELTPAEVSEANSLIEQLQGEENAVTELHDNSSETRGATEPSADVATGGQGVQGEEAAAKTVKPGGEWAEFPPESGTLGIPRSEMPQIKAEHRGALINFMNARGITSQQEEVPADSLKPTQAEYSPKKVEKAKGFEGGDRSILVSSDNHVLDGHHQLLAKQEEGKPVKIIRLNAPISDLVPLAHEFPSATTAPGAPGTPLNQGFVPLNVPSLSPAAQARVSGIDSRLGEIQADMPNRTAPVRASLQREAAQLLSEKEVIHAQAAEAAQAKPKQPAARQPSPIERRDDLVGAIMRVTGGNGIAASHAQTIVGDKANAATKVRGLFTNKGTADLGDTAMLLREQEGYDVKDGEHLSELIREQAAGNPVYSMERIERDAAANAEKQHKDSINRRAEELGLKKSGGKRTLDAVIADIAREEKRLSDLESDAEREAIQAADIADSIYQEESDLTEADLMQWLGDRVEYSQDEINEANTRSSKIKSRRSEARSIEISDEQAQGDHREGDGDRSSATIGSQSKEGARGNLEDQSATGQRSKDDQGNQGSNKGDQQDRVTEDGPKPQYQAGDRIVPGKDVFDGDIVKTKNGKLWMARVKRGDTIPVVPFENGKPVVSADTRKTFSLLSQEVTHTGENYYGHGGQPKPGLTLTGQTAAEIRQQEQDRVAAAAEAARQETQDAADKKAAEKKSLEDAIKARAANPDNFQFGEDAKAAAKPMGNLFDQPSANAQVAKSNAKEPPPKYGIYQLPDGSFAKFDRVWYRGEKTERAAMLSEMVIPGNAAPKDRLDSQSWVFTKGFSRNEYDGSPLRLTKNGEDAAVDASNERETADRPSAEPVTEPEKSESSTPSEMDSLKAEMGDAIGELASILGVKMNLTPEEESKIIPVMSKIFRIAAKMGYIKFADAAKYVMQQIRTMAGTIVADKISIENLQAGYINVSKEIGGDKREAMSYDSIEDLEKSENVTDERSSTDLERDSQDAEAADAVGEDGVRAGRDGDGGTGRQGVEGAEAESGQRGSERSSEDEAATAGEHSDQQIYTGAPELSPGSAGSRVDIGSSNDSLDGLPIESDAAAAVEKTATSRVQKERDQLAQQKSDNKPQGEGLAAVRAALPILTEGQQDDVFKTETRFAVPDGYGMLFTNGTGTGKTFSGLGVIKRMGNQGKNNILIVAPSDEIINAWQKAGKLLGLELTRLADTNDAGTGITITTYANMGANNALATRDWDMVVHDEAHYLAMDKDGTSTNALKNLRAITLHPDGVFQRHNMINAADIQRLAELDASAKSDRMSDFDVQWQRAEVTQKEADKLRNELKVKQDAIKQDVADRQGANRTRALFLSATPFAYEKTIDWANGYIFDYNEGQASEDREFRGYNSGSNKDRFFMQHFGYRMRTGKLTQPDAKVDSGLMQRQFNAWLKKKGSLSGRMLDVAADYDRKFILVDSAIGQRIDEALQWFEVKRKAQHSGTGEMGERAGAIMAKADPYVDALNAVRDQIAEKFDYLSRRYLLESIKAREVVPHIREHMAIGRKIVVFHDYKKGGGFNPFILDERSVKSQEAIDATVSAEQWNRVVREFNAEFKDIINSDLFRQSSPIDMFKQEFPGVLLFNGDVPAKTRCDNVAKFQDDASGPQIILVQSAAGKEGISLHDTTGKHQRVLFNLGQPTQPTTAIQQEGRIYRTGQVTDAMFRYLNTGTNWEKWAFATTIAQRASTAENLGMGEMARALKDAFVSGFEESGDYRAGMAGEGKGGKERDKAANDALTEYDRARAFYFGTQKKNSKTKAQEGADYFATPEPVGLKMVEWADVRPGERVLEPSAGHGAIARWFPDTADKTAIEPSMALRSRLAMVFNGTMIDTDFESMNVVNKFDAIVMNPPFGSGGKMAVEHLAKAATHLRDGGRIVALIPTGPAADKKFDKWMYGEEERAIKPLFDHPVLGPIYRGDTVNTRASWMKEGVIVRRDKDGHLWMKREGVPGESMVATESFTSVKPTGKRTEMVKTAPSLNMVADIKMPSVTFERAGTQVMTRIVVIEKQTAADKVIDTRGVYNKDFTGEDDINALFNRMENMALPGRLKERTEEEVPATKTQKVENPAPSAVGDVVTIEGAEYPIEIYVTNDGKEKRGIWMAERLAKALNPRAFKTAKNNGTPNQGKFFVDEYWLKKNGPAVLSAAPFSRGEDFTPISLDVAAGVVQRVRAIAEKEWKVDIRLVPTFDSLPDDTKQAIAKYGEDTKAKGVLHKGVIYLVADEHESEADLETTILHEAKGHVGIRRLYGAEAEKKLNALFDAIGGAPGLANIAKRRGFTEEMQGYALSLKDSDFSNGERTRIIMEELLSHIAQEPKFTDKVKAVVGAVRAWLRDNGFMSLSSYGETDLLKILSDASKSLSVIRSEDGLAVLMASSRISATANNAYQQGKQKVADLTSPESINTLVYNFQNKYVDLKNMQDRIKAIGGTLTDLNDAYLGEEMYHGKVMKKTADFLDEEIHPLLRQLFNNGIKKEDFEQYLHARHAPERNAAMALRNPNQAMIDAGQTKADADLKSLHLQLQNAQAHGLATKAIDNSIEKAKAERAQWHGAQAFKGTEDERNSLSGMSDAAAAQIMSAVRPGHRHAMDSAAAKVDAINAKSLDLQLNSGLIDRATYNAIKSAYKFYVPLHRDEAHPDSASHPIGQGFSVKGSGIKRATGSNETVTNILGHVAMNREAQITRSEKNSVSKRLYLLASQNPDKDFWSVGRPPTIKTIDPRTGFVRSQVDPNYASKPNVLVVRIAGKDAAIVFNEHNQEAVRLAGALKNLDGQDLDVVERTIGKATRWFAAVNTQYNPIFGIVNLMRDSQEGIINLTTTEIGNKKWDVAKTIPSAMRAIYQIERGGIASNQRMGDLWKEFQSVGGETGYRDLYASPEDRVKALEKELKSFERGSISKRAHAVAEWLSDYNTTMENAVRLSAYKVSIENGLSKERAASLAKNLTVNFNRKGAKAAKLGALYAFFNASAQGTARVAQTMRGPAGTKILIGGVAIGILQQALGMMIMGGSGDDDSEWDKIPDFIKENNLIFPIGHDKFVSIPLPLGLKVLPNIGRLFAEWATGGEDRPTGKQIGKLLSIAIGSFNPLGGSDVVDMVSPTVADPVISLLRNKDWTGKPIYREDMASLDPTPGFTRTKDSATPWAKGSSYMINLASGGNDYRPGLWSPTPDQIDYVIGQLTGGVGRELGKAVQTVSFPFTGDELPAHKIPLAGRLYGTTNGPSGQSEKFYENIKELNGIQRELKGRIKDDKDVTEFLEKEKRADLIGLGNSAESQVRHLRQQRRILSKEGDTAGAKEIDASIAAVMKGLNMEMRPANR